MPQYLYTDAGSDFTSAHIDQGGSRLGIVLCLRRRPAEGGIVERPFGTFNLEFFATLPGYTTAEGKSYLKGWRHGFRRAVQRRCQRCLPGPERCQDIDPGR
ncbi:MAG: hypothetical protein AAF773_29200 [Cyanobacteria bacterium P01_D01_bin.115]